MKSKFNVGYLYLLITFFCWGSIYIVSKYALAVMGPITVCCIRYAVSIVCLYGLLKLKGGQKRWRRSTGPISCFWASWATSFLSYCSWRARRC